MTDPDSNDLFDLEAFADGFANEDAFEAFADDCRYEYEHAVAGEAAEAAVAAAELAHGVVLDAEERTEVIATLMEDFEVVEGELNDDLERYVTPPSATFSRNPMQMVCAHASLRASLRREAAPPRCAARRKSSRRTRPRRSRRLVPSHGDPPRDADSDDHDLLWLQRAAA